MIIYSPESPSWLASKGRYEECRQVFRWLRGEDDPEQEYELECMIIAQKMSRKVSLTLESMSLADRMRKGLKYFNATIKKKEFFKPIVIMLHLYTMFQFAGINVISSYAMDIIHQVVGPDANAKFWMVTLDILRLVSNILAVVLMRLLKRRTMLFLTGFLCVLSYLGKAAFVYAKQHNILPFESQWIPIALIGVYMFSLAVGISSIPFTLSGEIFPLAYRGLGSGISVLALSLNFFIAVKCFPVLIVKIGLPLTYCLYASIVIYTLTVNWFMLPETKDRTLQEIEDSFKGKSVTKDEKVTEPLQNGNIDKTLEFRRGSTPLLY